MSELVRVLLVEDQPEIVRMVEDVLAQVGKSRFAIESVSRVSDGIRRLAEGGIDLILLDLSLPDSTGLTSFQRIFHAAPEMPIVVLTGLDDDAMGVAALREGAQDYILKAEMNPRFLVRTLRFAIERKKLVSEVREALAKLKTLSGLLPICACCKRIRDDQGYWTQVELFVMAHSRAEFTHGICPECEAQYRQRLGLQPA